VRCKLTVHGTLDIDEIFSEEPAWEIAENGLVKSSDSDEVFGEVSHCFNEIPQMTNGLASAQVKRRDDEQLAISLCHSIYQHQ